MYDLVKKMARGDWNLSEAQKTRLVPLAGNLPGDAPVELLQDLLGRAAAGDRDRNRELHKALAQDYVFSVSDLNKAFEEKASRDADKAFIGMAVRLAEAGRTDALVTLAKSFMAYDPDLRTEEMVWRHESVRKAVHSAIGLMLQKGDMDAASAIAQSTGAGLVPNSQMQAQRHINGLSHTPHIEAMDTLLHSVERHTSWYRGEMLVERMLDIRGQLPLWKLAVAAGQKEMADYLESAMEQRGMDGWKALEPLYLDDACRMAVGAEHWELTEKILDESIARDGGKLGSNAQSAFAVALGEAVVKNHAPMIRAVVEKTDRLGGQEALETLLHITKKFDFQQNNGAAALVLAGLFERRLDARSAAEFLAHTGKELFQEAVQAGDTGLFLAVRGEIRRLCGENAVEEQIRQAASVPEDGNLWLQMAMALPKEERHNITLPKEMQAIAGRGLPKQEFWQTFGSGNIRWQQVFHRDAPDEQLIYFSPFGFSQKVYDAMLPTLRAAAELEGYAQNDATVQAYKLAVLFSSAQEADRFLTLSTTRWSRKDAKTPVHDALLFDLPISGMWDVHAWKERVLRCGPRMARCLSLAPGIEQYAAEHDEALPARSADMLRMASKVRYPRAEEYPAFAELAISHRLAEKAFNDGLDLLLSPRKSHDRLPDVHIDGAAIGHPNYYMEKLPIGDMRGPLLGKITNCCQSIGGEGEDCAVHGMTSEYGGFYVWKHKTQGEMTPQDPIVAQSWAWIGKNGELVLDSFERLSAAYNMLAAPFLGEMARQVRQDFPDMRIGLGGNTPDSLDRPNLAPKQCAEPVDYSAYRDSKRQSIIAPARAAGRGRDWKSRVNSAGGTGRAATPAR